MAEFSFILLTVFALGFALYPLRSHGIKIYLWTVPLAVVLLAFSYWHWGAWSAWQHYLYEKKRAQQVQTIIRSLHGPQELIEKLKARVEASPKSAQGWYLLGRLYASQSQWQNAEKAFETAHNLKPTDEKITINYAQYLWKSNPEYARRLLSQVLQKNPNQPDALMMLASDAFQHKAYQSAIEYWQRLLALVPPTSEEARAINKAIVKARSFLHKR